VSGLDLGKWDLRDPLDAAKLLEGVDAPWWVAGGFAIDAFVGATGRRPHEDVDAGLLARDQETMRGVLAGWEHFCVDPPGTLRPWLEGEHLHEPIHDVWCRPTAADPWRLALMLNPSRGETLVYRRDPRISRPVSSLTFERNGIPYLAPEIQLLFKSKGLRERDELDFRDSAPLLAASQRAWLATALRLTSPAHPWLARL